MTIYGSSALIGIFFFALVLKAGWPDREWSVTNTALLAYILHIPVALLVLFLRRRMFRWPVPVQRMIWIVGATVAALLLLMLILFLR